MPTPAKSRAPARTAKAAKSAERLEARVSLAAKQLYRRAAEIQGSTLTQFVINSVNEAALRTVRENEFVELTYRDRAAFVESLLTPPSPNARLRRAAARHAQIFLE